MQQRKLHIASASEDYKRRCNLVLSKQTTRFDTTQIKAMLDGEIAVAQFMELDTDVLLSKISRNPPFMVLVRCATGDASCSMFHVQISKHVDRQAHAKMARIQGNIKSQANAKKQ